MADNWAGVLVALKVEYWVETRAVHWARQLVDSSAMTREYFEADRKVVKKGDKWVDRLELMTVEMTVLWWGFQRVDQLADWKAVKMVENSVCQMAVDSDGTSVDNWVLKLVAKMG